MSSETADCGKRQDVVEPAQQARLAWGQGGGGSEGRGCQEASASELPPLPSQEVWALRWQRGVPNEGTSCSTEQTW